MYYCFVGFVYLCDTFYYIIIYILCFMGNSSVLFYVTRFLLYNYLYFRDNSSVLLLCDTFYYIIIYILGIILVYYCYVTRFII